MAEEAELRGAVEILFCFEKLFHYRAQISKDLKVQGTLLIVERLL